MTFCFCLHLIFVAGAGYTMSKLKITSPEMRESYDPVILRLWAWYNVIFSTLLTLYVWMSPMSMAFYAIVLQAVHETCLCIQAWKHEMFGHQSPLGLFRKSTNSRSQDYSMEIYKLVKSLAQALDKPLFLDVCLCYLQLPFNIFYAAGIFRIFTAKQVVSSIQNMKYGSH